MSFEEARIIKKGELAEALVGLTLRSFGPGIASCCQGLRMTPGGVREGDGIEVLG